MLDDKCQENHTLGANGNQETEKPYGAFWRDIPCKQEKARGIEDHLAKHHYSQGRNQKCCH
jgi:hypothetical protein